MSQKITRYEKIIKEFKQEDNSLIAFEMNNGKTYIGFVSKEVKAMITHKEWLRELLIIKMPVIVDKHVFQGNRYISRAVKEEYTTIYEDTLNTVEGDFPSIILNTKNIAAIYSLDLE
ncbi:MAG: hypothetical protein HYW78_01330 [Parcubacteria group bacterium]|nr:hypothetical protein [Parcubacteria group bacterium]